MSIDPHADEPPIASPTSPQTDAALDTVKAKVGSSGMTILATALGKLSISIAKTINNELQQMAKVTLNKMNLQISSVPFIEVKASDVKDTIKSVNTTLSGVVTPDIVKIQKAAQATDTTADPSAVSTFTDKMTDHVVDQGYKRVNSLKQNLADVNGMKAAVERKI